jgi:hypothetical protein
MLWLAPDEKVFYPVTPEGVRCLIIGFTPHEETVPTKDEIRPAEEELYFEHCANAVAEEISSEAK